MAEFQQQLIGIYVATTSYTVVEPIVNTIFFQFPTKPIFSPSNFITMSHFLKTATLLFLIAFCAKTNAQTISAADKKGVEECYQAFMVAFEKLDASTIPSLLTENAEQIVPNGEIVRGKANVANSLKNYIEYLKTLPKPDRIEQENLGIQYRYLAPDVILSTYIDKSTMHFGDKTRVEQLASAVILHKSNGKWLVELLSLTPVGETPHE